MLHRDSTRSTRHILDEDFVRWLDGELSPSETTELEAHVKVCRDCRSRLAKFEESMAAFARSYRQASEPQLPSIAGPRALLRARLAELAPNGELNPLRRLLNLTLAARGAAIAVVAVLIVGLAGSFLIYRSMSRASDSAAASASMERGVLPNRNLTPGATRTVSAVSQVCSMPREETVVDVPTSLRQQVFQRYGIVNADASNYEVDYLIAPGLGGAEAIGNLWPEPYTSPTWNAHVKDDLEERLHEMVCDGQLDLSAAQREIATNWIAAYKKYFHTDRPLALHS